MTKLEQMRRSEDLDEEGVRDIELSEYERERRKKSYKEKYKEKYSDIKLSPKEDW